MNLSYSEALQYATWFLTLVEFILALYILFLNVWHPANRHVSALLMLFAINTFTIGLLLGGGETALLALPINAATVPAIQPALFVVTIVLIKPEWLRGRWRWLFWFAYGLVLLPIILTLLDLAVGTQLWYTGVDPESYRGGFVQMGEMTAGVLAGPLRILNIYVMGLAPGILLLYAILLDREIAPVTRRLAWLLLAAQAFAIVSQFGFRDFFGVAEVAVTTGFVFVLAYAFAAFQQMISERRAQRGRLQNRLTALVLAVAIPLLIAVVALVSVRATQVIVQKADEQLQSTNRALVANLSTWLDLNVQSLEQLVITEDVVSMDAERQKPVLEAMDQAHPHMYLISTTDLSGINVARSDDEAPKDYSDRAWVTGARNGELTFQVLVGRTSGEPALVASLPIRDEAGSITGVGMFASDLDDIAVAVQASRVGESGYAYVVNELNQVVAHPVPEYAAVLQELDLDPAVRALREGNLGAIRVVDDMGETWRAYVEELDNGWGVIVQEPEAQLLGDMRLILAVSGAVIVIGVGMLLVLTVLTIRQSLHPILTLTQTATAIAAGDLSQVAPVESEDEIGTLSRAFNTMTERLRDLIGSLEKQVTDRTYELEQRSTYLQATAEVGQVAASILDTNQLIQQVVGLIRERFGLYYVGLFLVDDAGEWAVLRAGTGEAGQVMLARGHRIRVGEGMVGWSVHHALPRVALEAGKDAVRLATPELPDTRSEAALPLRSRGRVLGALTVQHTEPGAFDPKTIAVFEIMADQVAVALDNARLFSESQAALEATRRAYGEVSRLAWRDLLVAQGDWGYRYASRNVLPAGGDWSPVMLQARQFGQTVLGSGVGESSLAIPLKVRDEVVGVLGFRKGEPDQTWTVEERELLEELVAQLGAALDSARLYQETRRRAAREELLGQVASRMRETLDMESVLKTTVQEVRQALGLPEVVIRLTTKPPDDGPEVGTPIGNDLRPRSQPKDGDGAGGPI